MPIMSLSFLFLPTLFFMFSVSEANFITDVDLTFGRDRTKISGGGQLLQLSLDKFSGAGFQSKKEYLFGKFDMQIKVVPGNSAGTVTAYYLSSTWPRQDEIDSEFLGNVSGEPYILHANVYTQGKGDREQQFYLWFDPRQDFHTYSVLWNQQLILFSVDGISIRAFRNSEGLGIPYPKGQPMRLSSTLWCADGWATRGGLVKTDWSQAPFIASYQNFRTDACVWSAGKSSCHSSKGGWWGQALDSESEKKLKWVKQKYMIYNYCTDVKRFPHGFPPECSLWA